MDSYTASYYDSTRDSTTDTSGDFWAKEDEEIARAEEAKYARAKRILRAQEFMERQRAPKYEPSALDNMVVDVLQTIDVGFTQLSDFAFGTDTVEPKKAKKKSSEKKKEEKKEEALPLTQEEIEQCELEALRALVEGNEPKIPLSKLNAIRADPPTGPEEESFTEESTLTPFQKKSAVDNDEASDLHELEIQINRYIDLIKKHEKEERRAQHQARTTGADQNNLMEILKEVEKRQEEEQLEPFQYRRQNMARDGEHQIWNYVGEYYTGGVKRNTNPTRVAPSPENILGRMAPRAETDEAKQARVSRMLDALDRRMAQKAAQERQFDDDEAFERALQRRELKKQQMYDQNILFGLLVDLDLMDIEEDEEAEPTVDQTERLSATLEKLDNEFYEEVKEAAKEDLGEKKEPEGDTGIVENAEEEEAGYEGGCLGCGAEDQVEDGTKADTTNVIDSQKVAYTPLNDQVSDASETSIKNRAAHQARDDPPENNGWFSFFTAPPKEQEPLIPGEIVLEDPPEEKRQESEEPKEQVHVKKGLKIVAILEGSDEALQVGTSSKPIMVREEARTQSRGNHLCWASSGDLLSTE